MIFLTLTGKTIKENTELIKKADGCIRGVELRADLLNSDEIEKIYTFPAMSDYPVILTVRRTVEGGEFSGSVEQMLDIYQKAAASGFAYFDLDESLEAADVIKVAESHGVRIIRSFHDFSGIPADFEQRIRSIASSGRFIPKSAVMINNTEDLYNFYHICDSLYDIREKIVLGMGAAGFSTRVLTHRTGSLISYTSFNHPNKALGHIDPIELCSVYRYNQIEDKTNLCGIIGNPVMHTKSPFLHNTGYNDQQIDYVYVPFEIDNIPLFIKLAAFLNIRGLSVTVPFKSDIIPYLTKKDESVQKIGACNTVVFSQDEKGVVEAKGLNTDYMGFIIPLFEQVTGKKYNGKIPEDFLKGKKCCMIGAGGAARAVIYALRFYGCEVTVFNRTYEKAQKLAEEFNSSCAELANIKNQSGYDIIVQTSAAGMHPHEELNPAEGYQFCGNEIAYDIIYSPQKTVFLQEAEKAGCPIINGMPMLKRQAEQQYFYFTGGRKINFK